MFPRAFRGRPSNFKLTWAENRVFESHLSKITRSVAAFKSLRLALLLDVHNSFPRELVIVTSRDTYNDTYGCICISRRVGAHHESGPGVKGESR